MLFLFSLKLSHHIPVKRGHHISKDSYQKELKTHYNQYCREDGEGDVLYSAVEPFHYDVEAGQESCRPCAWSLNLS